MKKADKNITVENPGGDARYFGRLRLVNGIIGRLGINGSGGKGIVIDRKKIKNFFLPKTKERILVRIARPGFDHLTGITTWHGELFQVINTAVPDLRLC